MSAIISGCNMSSRNAKRNSHTEKRKSHNLREAFNKKNHFFCAKWPIRSGPPPPFLCQKTISLFMPLKHFLRQMGHFLKKKYFSP